MENSKLLQDTLNNTLFTHASSILSQLKRSYGTECHAWLLEEAKNILVIAEQYDIQNGTEFAMLSDKIFIAKMRVPGSMTDGRGHMARAGSKLSMTTRGLRTKNCFF